MIVLRTRRAAAMLPGLLAGASLIGLWSGIAFAQTRLEPIVIEGEQAGDAQGTGAAKAETATGRVDGYVASQSASGTKTDTPLIETPQTINVITADQIEAQGATSVSEALRYTPGVIGEYRPGSRYDSMFIRGFGGGGVNANYVSFWDGLRIPKGLSYGIPTIDPYVLERVEVVKGPSSVLYGQISPGGFVNLVSKRPPDEPFGEVELVLGTNEHIETRFDIGGPVGEGGDVDYRVTGLYRQAEGDVDFTESERVAIAPEITLRPNADTTLTLQAYYQNDPEGGYYGHVPALGSLVPYAAGHIGPEFNSGDPTFDTFEREVFSAGYFLEHRIDDTFTVRQNLRYTHLDSLFEAVSPRAYVGSSSVLSRSATLSDESFDAISVDNQGEAKFTTGPLAHTVLAGVDYYYRDADRLLGQSATGGGTIDINDPVYGAAINPVYASLTDTDQTIGQLGVYLQDQVKWDRFTFVMGGRYDWSDIQTHTETVSTGAIATTSTEDEAFSWRTGLIYNFDNGFAPYVSYSTSFEPTTSLGVGNTPLEPVEGEQFEVGVKYQPKGMRSFVTLSWFDITQSNVLTTAYDANGTAISGVFAQLGEVTSQGLEAEAKIAVTDNLTVIASYAYTDAEISKDSNAALIGKTPASVPEHMASIWADYRFAEGPFAGLGIGAGVRFVGETFANNYNEFAPVAGVTPDPKVDAFTLVDASVRYDLGYLNVPELRGWEVAVKATNLFDEEYISGCLGSSTAAVSTPCWYGEGRTVLGSVKYRW